MSEAQPQVVADQTAPVESVTPPGQTAPETKPETTITEPPKEKASVHYTEIAKQRKAVLEAQKKIKAKEAEIAAREAKIKEFEASRPTKKMTPIEALQAAGYSYEDATNYILNNNELSPEQKIKALQEQMDGKLKEFESREEQRKKEEAERQKQAVQQQIEEFKEEINEFVEANKEKYELTHQYGGQEMIYETIATHYTESLKAWKKEGSQGKPPRVLSKEEAADLVEKHYEEEAEKVFKAKKFASKLASANPGGQTNQGQTPAQVRTLSNAAAASSAPVRNPARSEAERIQRAIEAAERSMQERAKN